MKRSLIVLAVLVAFLASACSRTHETSPENALTIAQQWEPRSLNPALENGTSSTEWSLLVFSYLVKFDDNGDIIPDVATAIPTLKNGGISADGKTIVYHIRKGVRFADGTPLTASDCAWSIEAINNPNNNVQSRFAYSEVARADAPNPTTLVLHLRRPFPPVLAVVGAPQGFPILPKHVLVSSPDFNHAAFNTAPFGSGPYRVTNWLHGDRVELEANPYYWKGPVKITHLTVRFVANSQTALNMLRTREIQGFFDDEDYANYPQLQALTNYHVTSTQENAVGAIIFNTQKAPVNDARVRHALAEAVDIPSLVQRAYHGSLDSRHAGAGLFLWAFDPQAYPDIPYDAADAKRLLDAAGWRMGSDGIRHKEGAPLDLQLIIQAQTPGDEVFADNVVQYERAIGARVSIKQFNVTQFVAPASEEGPVYGGKFDMALYSFENGDDPDTTDQFACKNVPPGGYNKSRICDPHIDTLLKAGLATYDPSQRKVAYISLQRLLYQELPIALVYRRGEVNAFTDRLQGQTTALSAAGAFWNAGAWYLDDPCDTRVFPAVGVVSRTTAPLHGPGLLLQGGGSDIDQAYRWIHDTLSGGSRARFGNVVVIRAHTDEDEYAPYMQPIGPFQSVQMLGVPQCARPPDLDALAKIVDRADGVFFAGGDQANYVAWKGSALDAAVQRVWSRGGVIGGTSAGLAVQGEYVYDSVAADKLHPNDDNYEVRTNNAVANPFEPEISFTHGFLAWPPLRNIITDTHFARRDRFGRTVAFLARLEAQQHLATGTLYALAVDERSAIAVDSHGVGTLMEYPGSGYRTRGAYLLQLISVNQLVRGKPLIATVRVTHLAKPGDHIDLFAKKAPGATTYTVEVNGAKTPPYKDPYG